METDKNSKLGKYSDKVLFTILTEIDKRDKELYEFINQINLPTYQGQVDAAHRLDAAIERVLAIGRKYNKK